MSQLPVIDADSHVEECEAAWEHLFDIDLAGHPQQLAWPRAEVPRARPLP